MVGIVWIPATTTSFLCLRQFVWWESPGVHCRGFFVCGYGRGVLLLDLFPPRNRTEEQRNACAHHISRRAQAHAGPARERRGRRAARREGPARRGRRHRPGAPVREGDMLFDSRGILHGVVPVRPYARETWTGAPDVGSVAGRTTGWACAAGGISTSAAPGSFWSTRPGGSIARSTGWPSRWCRGETQERVHA